MSDQLRPEPAGWMDLQFDDRLDSLRGSWPWPPTWSPPHTATNTCGAYVAAATITAGAIAGALTAAIIYFRTERRSR